MSKKFLINENWNQNEKSKAWIEMDGKTFYRFINSPEAQGRYFINLLSLTGETNDPEITIEASKAEYLNWCKEKRHKQHLRACAKNIIIFSYHELKAEDDCCGEELLLDDNINVQDSAERNLLLEGLREALTLLSPSERWIIDALYFSETAMTMRKLSALTGIPLMTLQDRKIVVHKKLISFLRTNPKKVCNKK